MAWFTQAFGFNEYGVKGINFHQVRNSFKVEGNGDDTLLIIKENGRKFAIGAFETPTVLELVKKAKRFLSKGSIKDHGGIRFKHIMRDCKKLHLDPNNEGAVFQVASQFNCLEMVNPRVKPMHGITKYTYDKTQGAVCAMACPAATLYRNYYAGFIPGKGQHKNQLDNTAEIAELVDNKRHHYWTMKNGYLFPVQFSSLKALNKRFDEKLIIDGKYYTFSEAISLKLRVGVQWNTETARQGSKEPHRVCQVFCSAVPVRYCIVHKLDFEKLGTAILNGAYEATLAVAVILAARRKQRVDVYWTCVGGGAFGNPHKWIANAMQRSLNRWRDAPINVSLIHYKQIEDPVYAQVGIVGKVATAQLSTFVEDDEKKYLYPDNDIVTGKKGTFTVPDKGSGK